LGRAAAAAALCGSVSSQAREVWTAALTGVNN